MQLIYGTGALGLAVMRELLRKGEKVKMVNRGSKPDLPEGVELVHGDAYDEELCLYVSRGSTVIYNCIGLPYSEWSTKLHRIQYGIIQGAKSSGAKLIYADNLYAYGPQAGDLHEGLEENPIGTKTRIRKHLSEMVLNAHKSGRIQAAIGRGSDFYGPGVRFSLLGERVFKAALMGEPAEIIGEIDQPHTHIFIDDFARGLVTLSEREESLGQVWHIPAAKTVSNRKLIEMIYQETGHKPKYRIAKGWLFTVIGWFVPMMREFKEIMYMMDRPFNVNHEKYELAFGVQVTPHLEAIRRTLEWYKKNIM